MMLLQESFSTNCEDFNKPIRRIYKKRSEKSSNDSSSTDSSRISNSNALPSLNSNYDWHRLLLARLKPGATGKYRTVDKSTEHDNDLPIENRHIRLRSFNDDSSLNETQSQMTTMSNGSDSLKTDSSSSRKENHFVKNSSPNRPNDRMTSLKRRVRKMRHSQNQTSIEEITVPLAPTDTNVLLVSYTPVAAPPVSTRRYRPNKNGSVVPLPPIPVQRRKIANQLQLQDIKYNLYVY